MENTGYRWRVPKQNDEDGWAEFGRRFSRWLRQRYPFLYGDEPVQLPTIGRRGVVRKKYNRASQRAEAADE